MKTLAKWSVEDYHKMIEVGILSDRRVELLEGEIVEMSPEGPLHYFLSDQGADYLRELLQGQAEVRLDGPITLSNSEPEPDIVVVQSPKARYRSRHPGPEEIFWIIEVSDSTLAKDLSEKKQAYAAAGIQEYWVVDVKAEAMLVFRHPREVEYLFKLEVNQGTVSPLAFPDVEVSVEKLLRGG